MFFHNVINGNRLQSINVKTLGHYCLRPTEKSTAEMLLKHLNSIVMQTSERRQSVLQEFFGAANRPTKHQNVAPQLRLSRLASAVERTVAR